MPITISPPAPAAPLAERNEPSDEDDVWESDGDVEMEDISRGSKRLRFSRRNIVTPGELVTDDPQWMR